MTTSCPTCSKAVDPLRARNVRVRDGKIVPYCSAECAQAAETKPTVAPRPPPATYDSGPVITIVKPRDDHHDHDDHDSKGNPKVGVNLAAMRELDRKHGRAPTPLPVAPSRRGPLIIVLVLVIGGAGALLAYRFLFSNRDVSASTQGSGAPSGEPVAVPVAAVEKPPPPEPPTPSDSVEKARTVLAANLASQSPRVQRVAAAALSRTGDEKAIALLAAALAKESSDIIKLDIAYALARAGDKRGRTALIAGLGSGRRDIKAAAGRALALLGDARAAQGLAPYLGVTQLRLGAAEALAYLAEPRALEVLDQLRGGTADARGSADAKTSPDDRARATIALGLAGRTDVIPDLHQLLKDTRFSAFAAHALARLKDPAARPILVDQLAIPSLRVDAARSLRVLDPTFDARPHLPALLGALESLKDTDQISVAEAILLLAGEASWSERP